MNTSAIPSFILSITLAGFLPLACRADFNGTDNFSAAAKDTLKWGTDMLEGLESFVQSGDGALRLVSTSNDEGSIGWPWIVDFAPFTNDWSAQVDVNVPFVELTESSSAAGFGLAVFKSNETAEVFSISLEQVRTGGPQQTNYMASLQGGTPQEISTNAPATAGTVRVSWNATSHLLTAAYDPDGATGGYNWTTLRTFDATTGSWGMTASDSFSIVLHGYTEAVQVALTNEIFADNFIAALGGSPTPPPTLAVSRGSGQVTLSWPATATGFTLQSNTNLAAAASWTPVLDPPVTNIGVVSVTVPASTAQQFFRLKNP